MPSSRTRCAPRSGVRKALLATSSIAILTALTGSGAAQASTLPTLTVTATASTIAVSGSPQAGAVNVVSSTAGVKEAAVILFQLRPGVKAAEVFAFLATKASGDPNTASKFGSIVFDAESRPRRRAAKRRRRLQPG